MITHEWGHDLASRPDVSTLLSEAATFDAEQGFQPMSLPDGVTGGWELVVRLRKPAGDGGRRRVWVNAAYLALSASAEARLVVRPEYRSLGVATSLVERLAEGPGAGAPDLGGVRFWAHGAHPAAERMARRFGLGTDRAEHELIVPMVSARSWWDSSGPLEVSELAESAGRAYLESSGAVLAGRRTDRYWLAAHDVAGSPVGLVVAAATGREPGEATLEHLGVSAGHRRRGVGRSLLSAVLSRLADAGHPATRTVVEDKHEVTPLLRSLGFRHDQTNLRYAGRPSPGGRPGTIGRAR